MKRNGARSRDRARIAAAFDDSTHKRARLATKRTAFDASPLAKRTVFAVLVTALLRFARGFASLFGGGGGRRVERQHLTPPRAFGKPKFFARIKSPCGSSGQLVSRRERAYARRGYGYQTPPPPKPKEERVS